MTHPRENTSDVKLHFDSLPISGALNQRFGARANVPPQYG